MDGAVRATEAHIPNPPGAPRPPGALAPPGPPGPKEPRRGGPGTRDGVVVDDAEALAAGGFEPGPELVAEATAAAPAPAPRITASPAAVLVSRELRRRRERRRGEAGAA